MTVDAVTSPTASRGRPPRAYVLRFLDGDIEPCAIVFDDTARRARRQFHAIDGAEYTRTTAKRAPQFDDGVPSAEVLMRDHGWYFQCHHCTGLVSFREEEPAPVVLEERADESLVAHADCAARAVSP